MVLKVEVEEKFPTDPFMARAHARKTSAMPGLSQTSPATWARPHIFPKMGQTSVATWARGGSRLEPGLPSLGQASVGPGELLIEKKLKEIEKEWLGLQAYPFSDVKGLKKVIAKLQATVKDAELYLPEPKKTTYAAQVKTDVDKHLRDYVDPPRISASKNRIKKQVLKLRGILKSPVAVTVPPSQVPTVAQVQQAAAAVRAEVPLAPAGPPIPYKTLIIGAAITTTVGIIIASMLRKK